MSAAYASLVAESPLQNVPSTPSLTTLQPDASPLAVVPEFVSQRSTPAPSPFINFIRYVPVGQLTPQPKTPIGRHLRELDVFIYITDTPLVKSSPRSDHVVPDVNPLDVVTCTPGAAAVADGGDVTNDMTSPDEDVLDVIDRLSQSTSDEERQQQFSLFSVDDEIFPI